MIERRRMQVDAELSGTGGGSFDVTQLQLLDASMLRDDNRSHRVLHDRSPVALRAGRQQEGLPTIS